MHRRRLIILCRSAAAVAAALLLAALLFTPSLFAPAPARAAVSYDSEELAFVRILNEYRQSLGLHPLKVSDLISDACDKHNSDMGKYGFNPNVYPIDPHTTWLSDWFPEGANARIRMAMCGYSDPIAWGEIIAAGPSLATTAFNAWKASPSHHPHMISPTYKVVGVSRVYMPESEYKYYWTVDFAVTEDSTARYLDDSPPSSTSSTTTHSSTTSTTEPSTPTTTTSTTLPPATTTTTTPPSTTTTTTSSPVIFTDVPAGHPFYEAITALATLGVVSGSQGLFHPDALVTRAQFAKIIVLALGRHTAAVDNADSPTFRDVPYRGDPYPFDFVEEAVALGIIKGRDDGTFGPLANVTRAQLALMLVRAGGDGLRPVPAGYVCPFTDVPAFARDAVAVAYYNGLLSGKTHTLFSPYSTATRGHVAKMVFGLYQALHR